ncbi:unnamed protein product [Rhizophagus irregularis]|nr:unnamed protein product [Rhizophagus irregularis]
MLKRFVELEPALVLLSADDESIKTLCPNNEEWIAIKDTILLLEPLEKATKYLSGTSYPTMVTSAILDPRNKLAVFTDQSSARQHIQTIYEIYKERASSSTSSSIDPKPNSPKSNCRYFLQLRQETSQASTSVNEVTPSAELGNSELDYYLASLNEEETDPLLWWQARAKEFPILSEMARDYLTIQATSVASEQIFSIAGHTITKTRNKLLPETARASLCMKSWISNNLVETTN